MIDLIIHNATVVNADGRQHVDVAVHHGKIVAIGHGSALPDATEHVDAGGLFLLPGVIDSHVHIREPGRTEREDFATATRAAAVSGVTMVCEMPISSPSVHNPQILANRIAAVQPKAYVDFAMYGAAAHDNLDDIQPLANAGIISFKTFRTAVPAGRESEFIGLCCPDPGAFYQVLCETAKTRRPAAIHAEDEYILARLATQLKAAGDNGPTSHGRARPPVVEEACVAQSIALARAANAWLHIVHVSSPYSVDLIRQAREAGVKVTCETCPPYLFLTDADLATHGPYAKTNPPVRDELLVEAMWERVARGDIDIIGTDHSPFLASEKEVGWDNMWAAPPGAPGIEILVPLMLTAVAYGRISLERMVALLSTNSAAIFGMQGRKGIIAVGADADFVLVDMAAEGRIDVNTWESKSRVTARLWHGRLGGRAHRWPPRRRRLGTLCGAHTTHARKAVFMTLTTNSLKAKLASGAMVTGTLAMDMRAPAYVHVLADVGFDSIFFDLEHGIYDLPMVADLIGTTRLCGITPIVRVPDLRYGDIARLLDAGAMGIMLPRIDTAAQVEEAMRHIKYPPRGDRGAASGRGATDYRDASAQTLTSHMNAQTMVIVQIERAQAVANLDAIASVPGVDMLLVGPFDLTIALGAARPSDPAVVAAMDAVVAAGKRHGIATGTHASDPAILAKWHTKGMQMMLCGSDVRFFQQGAKAMLDGLTQQ